METIHETRKQQISDFFLLTPPKAYNLEKKVQYFFMVILPIIPAIVYLSSLSNGISISLAYLLVIYLVWLRPRQIKMRKYNSRVSSDTINNWFLESLKTKILDRAIEYLELETKDFTKEQFIIIPYPVFNATKKIKDESVLRVKSILSVKNKNLPEEYCYHYTVWNIQIMVMSQSYLSYYFCSYNWLKNEIINEKTNEYFYNDIALIKTDYDQVSFQTKWDENPILEARITKLIHNSGDTLSLITELPELHQPAKTLVDIEKLEKTIRFLIRHAKAKDEVRKQVNINFKPADVKSEPVEI